MWFYPEAAVTDKIEDETKPKNAAARDKLARNHLSRNNLAR